jgi:hypothetical protein
MADGHLACRGKVIFLEWLDRQVRIYRRLGGRMVVSSTTATANCSFVRFFTSLRSAPLNIVPVRTASAKLAPLRSAPVKSAWLRLARVRFVCDKLVRRTLAPDKSRIKPWIWGTRSCFL